VIDAGEKSGEGLAGSGRRGNQNISPRLNGRPSLHLDIGGSPDRRREPFGDERMEPREGHRQYLTMHGKGALLTLPRHPGPICRLHKVHGFLADNGNEIVSQPCDFHTNFHGLTDEVLMNVAAQAMAPDDLSKKRGNILAMIVILLALGMIGGVISALNNTPSCPDELIGSWTTTAQGYEDTLLLISQKGIVFSAGEGAVEGLAVRRVETKPDGLDTFYTITYGTSRSDEQVLSFHYHSRTHTITFTNQSHLIWTRKTVKS